MYTKILAATVLIHDPQQENSLYATLLKAAKQFNQTLRAEDISTHEAYMLTANYVSAKSHCLSRNVGAILVNNDEIQAVGVNGNPGTARKPSCVENMRCIKDQQRNELWEYITNEPYAPEVMDLVKMLLKPTILQEGKKHCVSNCAERTAIDQYLHSYEYLHQGPIDHPTEKPLTGFSIYSTLFPCRLCAEEIVLQGITNVYYQDNYQTSLVSIKQTAAVLELLNGAGQVQLIQFSDRTRTIMGATTLDLDKPSQKRNISWKDRSI